MSSFDPNPVFGAKYQEQPSPCEVIQQFYEQAGVKVHGNPMRGRQYRWVVEEFGQEHVVTCTSRLGFVKLAVDSTNRDHVVKPFWSRNLQVDKEGNITTQSMFGVYEYTIQLPRNGTTE